MVFSRLRFLGGAAALALAASAGLPAAQEPDAGAGPPAGLQPAAGHGRFDGARAFEHLERLVAIGPRPAGSAGIRQARAYIGRQLAEVGLTVQEQRFTAETPVGPVDMRNLVARLPGRRADRILVTGHYDTKLMRDQVFVGASDGGSSAAFLLELARVLADSPREFTYELVWFDGEEAFCAGWDTCGTPASPDHTYGSRYYVQAARAAEALPSIRAMILIDMVGDRQLGIRRDTNSTGWLTDLIWNAASDLGHSDVFLSSTTTIEDDHVPFLQAGIPSVDIIDLDYPYWHTAGDTVDRVASRSLQIVGDVVLAALPSIEQALMAPVTGSGAAVD